MSVPSVSLCAHCYPVRSGTWHAERGPVSGCYSARVRARPMDPEEEVVSVQDLSISPNNCPLDEPLDLAMDFTITRDLSAARWEVKVNGAANVHQGERPGRKHQRHTTGHCKGTCCIRSAGASPSRHLTALVIHPGALSAHSSSRTKPISGRLCSWARHRL